MLLVLTLPVSSLSQKKLEVLFAYRPRAFETLQKHVDQVSIVAPETYVDENGIDSGKVEPELLKLAKEHGVKVMPQIKNQGFSQEVVHHILNDEKARTRTIKSMVDLCKQYGLWGMQVDFENVHVADKDALTAFYREAAAALKKEGFKISIAVVHRAEESAGPNTYTEWMMENWRGAYDLQAVDSLIKHHHGDPLKWDDKQKVSYGYIENGGVFEWFFIDNDIRSFEAKLYLAKKYKLRGINNWFSGQDDPKIWEGIREFSW